MRLPFLAICLIAVATLTATALLSGLSPGARTTSADACFISTPPPSSTPIPDNSVDICNESHQTADGLLFYVAGPMWVQPVIAVNAAGCDAPTTDASESPPDFTTKVTVTWPSACVAAGSTVIVAFDCSHLDDTPSPCQPALGCVSWTLGGQPLGSPCPTPNCGGVPCCNGLPCPTPTHPAFDGVSVPAGTPGDYDCDNMIAPADATRLLAELAGTPLIPLGTPCSIPTGITPTDRGDPTCDGTVDTRDVLAILQIVVEVREPGYCS